MHDKKDTGTTFRHIVFFFILQSNPFYGFIGIYWPLNAQAAVSCATWISKQEQRSLS
jgi:hypothetical protein